VIVKDDSLGTLEGNIAFVVSVGSTSVRAHQHAACARKRGCADWIEEARAITLTSDDLSHG
jgi:hypothetical protein